MEKVNLHFQVSRPIFVSVTEAARLAGVQEKTIRRALKSGQQLKFKINHNRYQIDLGSLLSYVNQRTKLRNKLNQQGLGQYVKTWQDQPDPPLIINQAIIKKRQAKNRLDS